jgi:hypothetical protein
MAMHANYWSCSKFADWLRGTPKLYAGTSKNWKEWREEAEAAHPFRYWLAEEALDKIQDFVTWPSRKLNDVRYYINNRWITCSHCLTAHPRDIKPGSWRDVGDRFLPCLFNELVDFVEIEQAWHHVVWDESARKEFGVPWSRSFFRFRTWRSAEAGVAHLKWAMTLTNEEFLEEDQKHLAEPTGQALAAKEILELYTWWTEVYAKRPDPMDAGGWSAYCQMREDRGFDLLDLEEKDESEAEICTNALNKTKEIEDAYNKEDEAMMIRLIRVRQALWT